ncbi:MAG: PTS system mannose/fructose/sorbose family transporter subunit IID [Gemmatimonadales bacterium]
MKPEIRTLARLLVVQASWNYERMSGLGLGHAAEPLLQDLDRSDPARHADALHRAAGFFNSHPYLAGVAVGAEVRAEYDGIPGGQIERLRAALCSPLGALGDQLFWAGAWPAAIGAALIAVALGAGWWAPGAAVTAMLATRLYVTRWALRTGLRSGMQVGVALQRTRLRPLVNPLGLAAALAVGAAVPLVIRAGLGAPRAFAAGLTVLVAAAGIAAGQWLGPRTTGIRFGLAALVATLVVRLVLR